MKHIFFGAYLLGCLLLGATTHLGAAEEIVSPLLNEGQGVQPACNPSCEPCCDPCPCPTACCRPCGWDLPAKWLYVSHLSGGGVGYRRGYTSVGAFIAPAFLHRCNSVTFFDVRGHWFDDGDFASNLGVGYRSQTCGCNAWGVNLFYDFRHESHDYHQLGMGFEWLGPCFNFRVNGYLPIGDHEHFTRRHVFHFDQFFAVCRKREKALGGVDAEIESCRRLCCFCEPASLYGAVGAYYYPRNCGSDIFGGKLRVGFLYQNMLDIEFRLSHDHVFHTRGQLRVSLVLPLDFWNCCQDSCTSMLYQPVQRSEIIVLDKKRCVWHTNF